MVVTYHFTTQLSIHRLQLFKIFIFSEDRHQTAANRPAGRAYAAGKTGVSILHGHKAETATYSASDIKRHYMLRLLCLKCALMHYNCPLSAWSPSAMKNYMVKAKNAIQRILTRLKGADKITFFGSSSVLRPVMVSHLLFVLVFDSAF